MRTTSKNPTVIKKYANRRLYHTGTSTYVTLEDLAGMIRQARGVRGSGRQDRRGYHPLVLTQIIFEHESKGTNLLPIPFHAPAHRFLWATAARVVPTYLESAMQLLCARSGEIPRAVCKALRPPRALSHREQTPEHEGVSGGDADVPAV